MGVAGSMGLAFAPQPQAVLPDGPRVAEHPGLSQPPLALPAALLGCLRLTGSMLPSPPALSRPAAPALTPALREVERPL